MPENSVLAKLDEVKDRVARAMSEAGRADQEIDITIVTKTIATERLLPLLHQGNKIFGENRVQEAQHKWPDLKQHFPDIDLRLIGPLQSNKVKEALALFDMIETVDRPKIAQRLAAEMDKTNRRIPCLIQVNIGQEPQKAGVAPLEALKFIKQCQSDWKLPVKGLMAIPPANQPPAPYFALLQKLADQAGLSYTSMGMSGDYAIACQMGASEIRPGSALFGARG